MTRHTWRIWTQTFNPRRQKERCERCGMLRMPGKTTGTGAPIWLYGSSSNLEDLHFAAKESEIPSCNEWVMRKTLK